MRHWKQGVVLTVLLASAAPGVAQEPAAKAPSVPVALYDQAVDQVGRGELDAAMASLAKAVRSGYQDWNTLRSEAALAPLRERDDWTPLMADFQQRNPWMIVHDFSGKLPESPWTEYAAGWSALADGSAPTLDRVSTPAVPDYFRQLHNQRANFVGDYDYAHANYSGGLRDASAAELGLVRLFPALPVLAEWVKDRQVVMLNESHGHTSQRAANFMFVRELRRLGFTHLALEALSYERVSDDPCRSSVLEDTGLALRGYAVRKTGAYTNDPAYAELVRMALAEGYHLVAYDHTFPDPKSPEREQEQARNIHCVLEADPEARIVVIGGGGHTSKSTNSGMEGGMMGLRLKALMETEPLSIANRVVRLADAPHSEGAGGFATPALDGDLAGQPYFADAAEGPHTIKGYDRVAFIPLPADRSAEAGWLRLGGWRMPAPQVSLTCEQAPCLLEARRVGEDPEAVPGDRCVIKEDGGSCQLFLAPGEYDAELIDADSQRSKPQRLVVTRPS